MNKKKGEVKLLREFKSSIINHIFLFPFQTWNNNLIKGFKLTEPITLKRIQINNSEKTNRQTIVQYLTEITKLQIKFQKERTGIELQKAENDLELKQ